MHSSHPSYTLFTFTTNAMPNVNTPPQWCTILWLTKCLALHCMLMLTHIDPTGLCFCLEFGLPQLLLVTNRYQVQMNHVSFTLGRNGCSCRQFKGVNVTLSGGRIIVQPQEESIMSCWIQWTVQNKFKPSELLPCNSCIMSAPPRFTTSSTLRRRAVYKSRRS